MSGSSSQNLLIVANFPSKTGYAWKTIHEYFLALGQLFVQKGRRAIICYPKIDGLPPPLQSTDIEAVRFDLFHSGPMQLYSFLRKYDAGFLYLTDRPVFSPRYAICRLAGVKKIVVHDRTSGHRDPPKPLKKFLKKAIYRFTFISADIAIAISDYVKKRLIQVACLPTNRIVRIWNGVDIEKFASGEDAFVFKRFDIPAGRKIVFAYSRANRYKGIDVLIEAAEILVKEKQRKDLFFLFCGEGPDLQYFRDLIIQKHISDAFLCPGQTNDIDRILKGVAVVVVPSIWHEGFGLSAVEAMSTGKVVIGSRVGGIPEIIDDGANGYLVAPGESRALAEKIVHAVENSTTHQEIGNAARVKVIQNFNLEDKKNELQRVFRQFLDANAGAQG